VDDNIKHLTDDELVSFLREVSNSSIEYQPANSQTPNPAPSQTPYTNKQETSYADEDINDPIEPLGQEYERMDFLENGAHVLTFFDDDLRTGKKLLHPWQVEVNEEIANFPNASINNPLRYCLCASNGSGKDAYVIAGTVVYFALRYIRSKIIITTSSGSQLTSQTEAYIRNLCEKVNKKCGEPIFKINQRNIKSRKTGSTIFMFVTDEPGKAEGHHPWPDSPDGKCLIILNECKSIPEEIIEATKRCSPTHLLYVSSAGEQKGSFYWAYCNWSRLGMGIVRRITSYDCPHKDQKTIEMDKLEKGEHSAWFRSKHLSLFTTIDGMVVINEDMIAKCKQVCKEHRFKHWPIRIGMDLAAGGDECVVCITHGNKIIARKAWEQRDTTISADIIDKFLTEKSISKTHEYIFADDGGVGRAIIDMLRRRGWNVKRVLNQWAAHDKVDFGNVGAEMWFSVSRIIEQGQWFFDEETLRDEKFMSQLVSRHYRKGEKDKTYLRKKEEERAEGFPSPDRADAFILSLRGLRLKDFLGDLINTTQSNNKQDSLIINQEALIEQMQNQRYHSLEIPSSSQHNRIHAYDNEELLEGTRFHKTSLRSSPNSCSSFDLETLI